jgi:hypothetical protein
MSVLQLSLPHGQIVERRAAFSDQIGDIERSACGEDFEPASRQSGYAPDRNRPLPPFVAERFWLGFRPRLATRRR